MSKVTNSQDDDLSDYKLGSMSAATADAIAAYIRLKHPDTPAWLADIQAQTIVEEDCMNALEELEAWQAENPGMFGDGVKTEQPELITPATRLEILAARYEFGSEDCYIDDDAKASRAETGLGDWIQAWVWIGTSGQPDSEQSTTQGVN